MSRRESGNFNKYMFILDVKIWNAFIMSDYKSHAIVETPPSKVSSSVLAFTWN